MIETGCNYFNQHAKEIPGGKMKQTLLGVLQLAAVLLIVSCKKDSITPSLSGLYEYTAFDSAGKALVHGSINLDAKDSSHVSGTWQLDSVGSPKNVGPQLGRGNLAGNISSGKIQLNLNPNFVDNNVFLVGAPENGVSINGSWQWITFAGITNQGSFTAKALLPD